MHRYSARSSLDAGLRTFCSIDSERPVAHVHLAACASYSVAGRSIPTAQRGDLGQELREVAEFDHRRVRRRPFTARCRAEWPRRRRWLWRAARPPWRTRTLGEVRPKVDDRCRHSLVDEHGSPLADVRARRVHRNAICCDLQDMDRTAVELGELRRLSRVASAWATRGPIVSNDRVPRRWRNGRWASRSHSRTSTSGCRFEPGSLPVDGHDDRCPLPGSSRHGLSVGPS